MSSENIRLTLSIDFNEHGIHPAQVLIDESITASQYGMGGPTPSPSLYGGEYIVLEVRGFV
jgi:hypothetical protein